MTQTTVLKHLREIDYKKPSDIIIEQMNKLISEGVLKPGDVLPSERALAERFGVGRGYVREALRKLEFYGILKTVPQRGTVVASLGVKALEGLIANVLNLGKDDIDSLMEAREVLEVHAAALAAERATDEDRRVLKKTHDEFRAQVASGKSGIDEDLLFHIRLSEASKNTVLRSLISLITPDILNLSGSLETCRGGRSEEALEEHSVILAAVEAHDADAAAAAMANHMKVSHVQFTRAAARSAEPANDQGRPPLARSD